ncbi:uncharacterized protein TRAVEDRAFT_50042 [Trametes versicolor FP-101664 SS1]|uniref:uncharacterized protein n=1 Tax=Trametes versicolor (strain FP-101664) TaxID=717944 RepID=UPI0004621B46|nr:uncharacterized protein TRAVEDRAFT_50042 [Trametes versicolor FP-101664 SS1]EIW55556.1 hypothetical protein TRAVEDRAFT_50042 [Trametes versicolor FP-101664 SS1]
MATPRRKVVVARNLGPDVMSLLNDHPELEVIAWPHENKPCDRKWLLENIPGAYGVLVMYFDKVDVELLEAAGSSLRAVSTFSVGYEHINVPELVKRGIKLGYTPDVLTDSMADMSIMLALMAGRNVKQTHEIWPAFVWSPFGFCGPQISANPVNPKPTAGFIGFGRIAHATLARLIPFGFARCLYTGNPATPPNAAADAKVAEKYGVKEVRRTDLSELARESDVVFALAPGGPSTFHIIDEAFLKQMKKTAVLVNTGRGTLIDSDALAKALQEGWLYGAGLDVVEGEPGITQDHPLVKSPRCIILPHVGSATTETRLQMGTLAANNLINGVLGTPMPVELNTSH